MGAPHVESVASLGRGTSFGGSQVGIIAKRTYRVVGQRCVVDDEQVPLVEVQRFSDDKAALQFVVPRLRGSAQPTKTA